ncbi:MAG: PQQ-binding-like beta-propeller repeat protein [Thermomonas sp.]|uniref:pilus assembly protein n=1 Tax=Thermomonas sp. TaxID=1971895 RepID=UPI001ED0FB56|nr:PilC/PilY family type IV pilus protein [Thermomonas sp.]MBV2209086.1 PQQ-binding-like beta-propeller repeat protein [Thermomonas sp.]
MKNHYPNSKTKLVRAMDKQRPVWVTPVAFLATILALPVNAGIVIPDEPLMTGVRVAPNILFILDDSGSMRWENINNGSIAKITGVGSFSDEPSDDGVSSGNSGDLTYRSGNNWMFEQAYTTNTMYYNPGTTYQPWVTASGSRVTGGTSYGSAYDDTNLVSYTDPLTSASTSSGTVNLADYTRTFYVPKNRSQTGAVYLSNVENYYRYQILAGGSDIVQSHWGKVVESGASLLSVTPASGTVKNNNVNTHTLGSIPAGETLELTIRRNTSRYGYFRLKNPSGIVVCAVEVGDPNPNTCTVSPTVSGVYTVEATDANPDNNAADYQLSARYYTTNRCGNGFDSYDWIDCASGVTPTGRSLDAEKANFATWYSYYRTRIKAAKGGAAEAFNTQGRKVRVGYRTIWNRSNFDIPVGDGNDGRFVNGITAQGDATATTSRSTWFNRLFAAEANNGTPLQTALNSAGQYFSGSANTGPYGPESGTAQFSCRQNFTILTTDGYWNNSTVNTGTNGDDNDGSLITNDLATTDPNYKGYQYKKAAPYPDGVSNSLADVAMRYWKNDLRTDLANNVPSSYSKVAGENDQVGRDPAFWQHMVTFTISIGLKTTSGLSSVSQVTPSTTWPSSAQLDTGNANNDTKYRLDDLLHAAVNGRGSFVSASSPQEFADGLSAALAAISQRTGSFSNTTASDATSLNTGTKIFKASYVSGLWTGGLKSETVTTGAENWQASIPVYGTTRKVFTMGSTAGASFPTASQVSALDKTGVGAASYEVSGADNANYILGDQSKEGTAPGKLRVRTSLLGDIVNSSPAYVSETDTVYIGANDGMMHAFDASNGNELFAYVPSIINFAKLKDFSAGDYTHQWFVDGPIVVSKRSLGPSSTNILVGALGRGGKGLYALDVTNPSSFAAANVKWERASTSATPSADNMGQVLGAPVLAAVRTSGTATTPAVIVGNGINSSSGKAALLVLNLTTGAVIKEIATDATLNNGLSTPTGLYAADGKTLVYAYAGDMQGNIWKFDMTSTNPAAWSASKVFHAEKTAGTPQPITGGLVTAVDPRTNTRWVFFGTGSYLSATDGNDKTTSSQSMYGVMDDGTTYTRANLDSRSVTTDASTGRRYFQELSSLSAGKKGWYVDLTGEGERIVQNAQIDGSFLVTASMMPSGNSCDDVGGSGYINALQPFPGIATGRSYFDLDGDGTTDDAGTAGKPTGSVKTNGMPTLPVLLPGQLVINTSSGETQKINKGQALWNRVSWREIRND